MTKLMLRVVGINEVGVGKNCPKEDQTTRVCVKMMRLTLLFLRSLTFLYSSLKIPLWFLHKIKTIK